MVCSDGRCGSHCPELPCCSSQARSAGGPYRHTAPQGCWGPCGGHAPAALYGAGDNPAQGGLVTCDLPSCPAGRGCGQDPQRKYLAFNELCVDCCSTLVEASEISGGTGGQESVPCQSLSQAQSLSCSERRSRGALQSHSGCPDLRWQSCWFACYCPTISCCPIASRKSTTGSLLLCQAPWRACFPSLLSPFSPDFEVKF